MKAQIDFVFRAKILNTPFWTVNGNSINILAEGVASLYTLIIYYGGIASNFHQYYHRYNGRLFI